jgi:hypothetical protein
LKKPFRDCWPFAREGLPLPMLDRLDLLRLTGFVGDIEGADRFSGEFSGLGMDTCPFHAEAPFAVETSGRGVSSLSGVLVAASVEAADSLFVAKGVSIVIPSAAVAAFTCDGFLLNMSRIFRLLVNSVSNLPLRDGTSFVGLYSLWRKPFLYMPDGFIMSIMCTSSPGCALSIASRGIPQVDTLSWLTAYTGQ